MGVLIEFATPVTIDFDCVYSAAVQLFFPLQDLEAYAISAQPEALEASEADAVRCGDTVIEIDTTHRDRRESPGTLQSCALLRLEAQLGSMRFEELERIGMI